MQIETLDQFLKRGGKIKKVDFSNAYGKAKKRHNLTLSKKLTELQKQKIRDSQAFR